MWQSRHGSLTSIRLSAESDVTRRPRDADAAQPAEELDPLATGLIARDVSAEGDASRGATDFGDYFTYFSFFLVVSALLLAVLFFKLGVEQRVRESACSVLSDSTAKAVAVHARGPRTGGRG